MFVFAGLTAPDGDDVADAYALIEAKANDAATSDGAGGAAPGGATPGVRRCLPS